MKTATTGGCRKGKAMRCMNALCNERIVKGEPHITAEVVGVTGFFCDTKCLEEFKRQNLILIQTADPFHEPRQRKRRERV